MYAIYYKRLRSAILSIYLAAEPTALATYALPTEPSLIALGGSHVCCASGSLAWFYPLSGGAATRRQYPGPIDVITLAGDYAAALFQGRAMLHAVSSQTFVGNIFSYLFLVSRYIHNTSLAQIDHLDPSQAEKEAILFPEPHMQAARIVDIHLTSDFFIFVTDVSILQSFHVSSLLADRTDGFCRWPCICQI